METLSKTPRRRMRYKIRGPKVWAAALTDYQAGATAQEVCDKHDVGLSNLAVKARDACMRKRDLPDVPLSVQDDPDASNGEVAVDMRGAARAAVDHAIKLMKQGHFRRASEAAKAADTIGRLVERMTDPEVRDPERDAAVMEELHRKILALAGSDLDEDQDDEIDGKADT